MPSNRSRSLRQAKTTYAVCTEAYEGPLPSPEILARYDQVCPGAAERILVMAENQARHRQELEAEVIRSRTRDSRCGIFCGLAIGITSIVCGTVAVIWGHSWAGTLIGTGGVAGLVGVFIYGTNSSRAEREAKASQN